MPKDVQFIVPQISCADKQELWYHIPEASQKTMMTSTLGCKVGVIYFSRGTLQLAYLLCNDITSLITPSYSGDDTDMEE